AVWSYRFVCFVLNNPVMGKISEWRKGKFYIFLMLIMHPTSKREHQVFIKHILMLKTVLPSVLKFRIKLKFLADRNAQSATKPSIVMLLCLYSLGNRNPYRYYQQFFIPIHNRILVRKFFP